MATLLIIVFDLLRADLVAILVMAILPLTGIITVQEAFSGFLLHFHDKSYRRAEGRKPYCRLGDSRGVQRKRRHR